DGSLVAIERTSEEFGEDCGRVVSARDASGGAQARWRCVASASALRSPPHGLWAMTARGDALLRQKATRPRRLARCHPRRATPRRAKTIWRQATEAVVPLQGGAGIAANSVGTARPACPGCARGWAGGF